MGASIMLLKEVLCIMHCLWGHYTLLEHVYMQRVFLKGLCQENVIFGSSLTRFFIFWLSLQHLCFTMECLVWQNIAWYTIHSVQNRFMPNKEIENNFIR